MEILLDAGANLEHQDDISGTPLHGAARRNLSQCCRVLLNRGALVDAYDGVGNTPLHLAAAEGAISTVRVRSTLRKFLLVGRLSVLLYSLVRSSEGSLPPVALFRAHVHRLVGSGHTSALSGR